jgi:DNA-binding MarR family transcriptional regulator
MAPADNLDAAEYERLAREAVAGIDPPPDVDAMLVSFNLIRAANRVQQDLETSVHRPAGVTWAAFRVLFTVFCVGPIAPAQLAHLSSVSAASISSVLNTLERNKLIKRRPSSSDGRSVVVDLTTQGRRAVTDLFTRNNARESAWATALTSSERATFTRLLRKLLTHHPEPVADPARRLVPSRRSPTRSART